MNGRERLEATFHRQPVDRLAWTSLVDGIPVPIERFQAIARWMERHRRL